MMDKNDPAALGFEAKIHPAKAAQGTGNGLVAFARSLEHQEAAGPSAQKLATHCSRLEGSAVPLVDGVRADVRCEALFEQPAFMNNFPQRLRAIGLQVPA